MSRAERRREMRGQEKKEVTRVMTIAQIQEMKKDMADLIADELLMKVFGIATLVNPAAYLPCVWKLEGDYKE